ncbi:MAG: alpha/beta hydrolase [Bdellovibrionales bacterium]|nr:alpha/beta hydrolase [Bdellovibrionales bacterium]
MIVHKQTGYVKSFDGTSIYYETRGSGPAIVMAYGIVCTMNHWRHQTKYFSENYKTVLIDYRGHHNSGTPNDRDHLSFDGIAQDFKAVMDHLEIPTASFWGHSFGVQALIRMYDMFPQYFENLVFINGFANNPIKGMFGVDFAASTFKLLKQSYDQLPETLSYFWKAIAASSISMKLSALAGGFNLNLTSFKDIEIYARGVAGVDLDVFLQLMDQMMSYDGRPVLERIAVPTLIVSGSADTVTPKKYQEYIHKKIKGSEFVMIPYGSHCTQLDLPDYVNLRIERFLKDHPPK